MLDGTMVEGVDRKEQFATQFYDGGKIEVGAWVLIHKHAFAGSQEGHKFRKISRLTKTQIIVSHPHDSDGKGKTASLERYRREDGKAVGASGWAPRDSIEYPISNKSLEKILKKIRERRITRLQEDIVQWVKDIEDEGILKKMMVFLEEQQEAINTEKDNEKD